MTGKLWLCNIISEMRWLVGRVANGGSSVKAKDVLRELGSVWRTLDAGEKQKYLKH